MTHDHDTFFILVIQVMFCTVFVPYLMQYVFVQEIPRMTVQVRIAMITTWLVPLILAVFMAGVTVGRSQVWWPCLTLMGAIGCSFLVAYLRVSKRSTDQGY